MVFLGRAKHQSNMFSVSSSLAVDGTGRCHNLAPEVGLSAELCLSHLAGEGRPPGPLGRPVFGGWTGLEF